MQLGMLAVLAASGALVLILIIALGNPFRGDFRIIILPFQHVRARMGSRGWRTGNLDAPTCACALVRGYTVGCGACVFLEQNAIGDVVARSPGWHGYPGPSDGMCLLPLMVLGTHAGHFNESRRHNIPTAKYRVRTGRNMTRRWLSAEV